MISRKTKFSCLMVVAFSSAFLGMDSSSYAETNNAESKNVLIVRPAEISSSSLKAPIFGASKAANRVIGVGDYGTVLLSDDGVRFHQAKSVPVSSALTSVSFIDYNNGWAVGHWGVILNTVDGGEHWAVQRVDTGEDRPLFSVHFYDAQHGLAVGLWSLVLTTDNGGKSWSPVSLPEPPEGGKADRNLFKIFTSSTGATFIAAERGVVLRSEDKGKTWSYVQTGYNGSFWSGIALDNGSLLVGGLRGTIYKSTDDGKHWAPVNTGIKSSITDITQTSKYVIATGLDGMMLMSKDGGNTFISSQRGDRLALTATIASPGNNRIVVFSKKGPVEVELKD